MRLLIGADFVHRFLEIRAEVTGPGSWTSTWRGRCSLCGHCAGVPLPPLSSRGRDSNGIRLPWLRSARLTPACRRRAAGHPRNYLVPVRPHAPEACPFYESDRQGRTFPLLIAERSRSWRSAPSCLPPRARSWGASGSAVPYSSARVTSCMSSASVRTFSQAPSARTGANHGSIGGSA